MGQASARPGTPFTWYCLQELLSRGNIKQHALLNDLLSLPGWDILDECDQLLSHKFQLVYAWGSQAHLPSLEARVQMAQAVLEALALDARCQDLLSNRDIAQIRHHTDRIGSMPHVRLIPGAYLLSSNNSHAIHSDTQRWGWLRVLVYTVWHTANFDMSASP